MTISKQMVDEISRMRQLLAKYDDAGREIFGAFAIASRLFEMTPDYTGPVTDGVDAQGNPIGFHCKFSDADMAAIYGTHTEMKEVTITLPPIPPNTEPTTTTVMQEVTVPNVTAQEFAVAFFGAVEIAYAIPTPLADLIGKVRM